MPSVQPVSMYFMYSWIKYFLNKIKLNLDSINFAIVFKWLADCWIFENFYKHWLMLFYLRLFIWFLYLFSRRFGTKCAGCTQGISPNDLVRRARNKVFHLKCFTCIICRKQLSTGEELYVMDENRFICKEDYISSKLQGRTLFLYLHLP